MDKQIESTIRDIDFTMTMENMPLTEQDKKRLRDCLTGKVDTKTILHQIISQYKQKAG